MQVRYKSTRGGVSGVTASQAILRGLADDGGLFIPEIIPLLDRSIEEYSQMSYQELAYNIMKLYLTDYSEEELRSCVEQAYNGKFDDERIVPIRAIGNVNYMELFHGSTIAFKDMALSILPHLMTTAAKKNGEQSEIVILTATSGDTGKAAMAGFADVAGTRIIVFYPSGGVSTMQERQMLTQKGNNTRVVGCSGNFDDAQNGVKKIFEDKIIGEELKSRGYILSSANSINIGRLVPQIVYYIYGYCELIRKYKIEAGEEINVVVPTGNFGNILAAYYSMRMGLPIHRLVCASNENNVLNDFFRTGKYDKNREFILTDSPSMDILISSNLERLLYECVDSDAKECAILMKRLSTDGIYSITDSQMKVLEPFYSGYATQVRCHKKIAELYKEYGYIIDTHTAVASVVYDDYLLSTQDTRKALLASTASPYKFPRSVLTSLDVKYADLEDEVLISELNKISNVAIPDTISEAWKSQICHNVTCEHTLMKDVVLSMLK